MRRVLLVDFRLAAHDTERVAPLLGGTSGNTAFGLAHLEVKTTILAKVGDDYFGRLLRDDMASVGVDTSLISLHATAPTMVNMAVVEPQGARNMFTWPDDGGALWRIKPEDVPDGLASSVGWALSAARRSSVIQRAAPYGGSRRMPDRTFQCPSISIFGPSASAGISMPQPTFGA